MSVSRFKVVAKFDGCGAAQPGSVVIGRQTGVMRVRAKHARRYYELPLSAVVDMVVQSVLKAEVAMEQPLRKRKVRRSALKGL